MAAPWDSELRLSCFAFVILLLALSVAEDEFEGSRTLVLEHSFQSDAPESYLKRGTVVIQSLKGNKAMFTPNSHLSQEDIDSLRTSAENNGLYRIRLAAKTVGDVPSAFVSSATTACSIVESGLKDVVTVNFDQSGEVLGVSIHAKIGTCTGAYIPNANLTSWRTAVEVTTTVSGPLPDTQTYIEKMKRDEQMKMKNQDGDNRSFIGKYWMYIVPVVIMMLIMSSADQQGQGGGGGGGGGGR